jgi:predicted  nucleic acid-binding Zn-ribbon protein
MAINMPRRNNPISQVDIEEEILRFLAMLEEETEAFERLAEDAAKKEAGYKAEWAKAYLSAQGSIKEREAWADYQLADHAMQHKIAEGLVKAKREKLSSLRTGLDALRTLSANVRVQVAP